jgi:hypothetical protein
VRSGSSGRKTDFSECAASTQSVPPPPTPLPPGLPFVRHTPSKARSCSPTPVRARSAELVGQLAARGRQRSRWDRTDQRRAVQRREQGGEAHHGKAGRGLKAGGTIEIEQELYAMHETALAHLPPSSASFRLIAGKRRQLDQARQWQHGSTARDLRPVLSTVSRPHSSSHVRCRRERFRRICVFPLRILLRPIYTS